MIKKLISPLLVTALICTTFCVCLNSDSSRMDKDNFLKQYHEIPKKLKDKAKIAFIGEYWTGRSSCVYMEDGSREWFTTAGFEIKQDFIGNIKVISIGVHPSLKLIRGANYIVLLNPTEDTIKIVEKKGGIFTYLNSVSQEEIIKIVEAK